MSKSNQAGRISKVSAREWHDERRNENITLYSFILENQAGWYRTGTKKPSFAEGNHVEFVFETSNNNVDFDSIKITAAPSSPAGETIKGAAPAVGGGREDYWQNKAGDDKARDERYQTCDVPRMSFSASQDRAVQLVSAALAADALSFGSATKGKRLDMLLDYVDLVTDRFFCQAMGSPEHFKTLQIGSDNIVVDTASNLGEDYD